MNDDTKKALLEATGGQVLYKMGRIEEAVDGMAKNIEKQTIGMERLHDRLDKVEEKVDNNTKEVAILTTKFDDHIKDEMEMVQRLGVLGDLISFVKVWGKLIVYCAALVGIASGIYTIYF